MSKEIRDKLDLAYLNHITGLVAGAMLHLVDQGWIITAEADPICNSAGTHVPDLLATRIDPVPNGVNRIIVEATNISHPTEKYLNKRKQTKVMLVEMNNHGDTVGMIFSGADRQVQPALTDLFQALACSQISRECFLDQLQQLNPQAGDWR